MVGTFRFGGLRNSRYCDSLKERYLNIRHITCVVIHRFIIKRVMQVVAKVLYLLIIETSKCLFHFLQKLYMKLVSDSIVRNYFRKRKL